MILPLLLATAHALDLDTIRTEGATSLIVHAFGAPTVARYQQRRGFVMPSVQLEGEIRTKNFGVRGRVGVGVAIVDLSIPPAGGLDAAIMAISHAQTSLPENRRYYGFELGVGRVFAHTRFYAGPLLGAGKRWKIGMLEGEASIRASLGVAYELGNGADWTLLTPGPALGVQGGVALVFTPVD
jgi:hypothetical protein